MDPKTKPKSKRKPKPTPAPKPEGTSSANELADLAARVIPEGAPGGAAGADRHAGASPGAPPGADKARPAGGPPPELVAVCTALASAVGAIFTTRLKVDPLTEPERVAVGAAAAGVAAQYDIAGLSPKAAAWMSLGIAVAGVAMPRIEQYNATIDVPVTEPANDNSRNEAEPESAPASEA